MHLVERTSARADDLDMLSFNFGLITLQSRMIDQSPGGYHL